LSLRGVGALMFFQIQLALINRKHILIVFQPFKKINRSSKLHPWQPLYCLLALDKLNVCLRWATSTVAITVNKQCRSQPVLLNEIIQSLLYTQRCSTTGVIAFRGHVRQHTASINTNPVKRCMRKFVIFIPCQLNSSKIVYPAFF
jgi:hypothetical protein